MTAGMPAAVAISAATTFERIPPEPSGEVAWPISSSPSRAKSSTSSTSRADASVARIGREQAVDVREQDEQVGADEDRHLGGEEVVVAEGDLVGRRRVVLVDDRDDAPVQQPAQRLARIEVVGARAHVEEGQQHLRARHAALAQQLVVDAVELALAHGAGGLQVLDRGRPRREAHDLDAAGDRAGGHHHDVVAGGVAGRHLVAHPGQHGRAQRAGVLGDDARTELDDVAGHGSAQAIRGPARTRRRAISTSSPGSKPAASSARITPMRCRRCSMCASASSLSRSKRATRRSTGTPLTRKAPSPTGSTRQPRSAAGTETRCSASSSSAASAAAGCGASTGTGAAARGRARRARRRVALEVTSTGTSVAQPLAPRRPRPRRRVGGHEVGLGQREHPRQRGEARIVRGELVLDRLPVGGRVRAVQRREVEHVDEQPRALDVREEVVAEPRAVAGALDQPRDVGQHELALVGVERAQYRARAW